MRALFWIVGAVISAAGGALLLDRRAKRRRSGTFLAALREGPVDLKAYEAAIVAPKHRIEAFSGLIAGKPFILAAQADASGTRWTFALEWDGGRLLQRWNPLEGEDEHPLKQAYDLLRRHAARKDGGLPN